MSTRFIKKNEIKDFLKLVKYNYKKNHILGRSNKIVNFYYNFHNKKNTYIIGYFKKEKLVSALGLIPNKNWDNSLRKDYFIAFWVKKKNTFINSLNLMNFILNRIKPSFLATTGINLETSGKIFSRFNTVNNFDNFYIVNKTIKKKVSKNLKNNYLKHNKKQLKLLVSDKFLKLHNFSYSFRPYKSEKYFKYKYTQNPFYKYFMLNFYEKNKIKICFICREIKIQKLNSKILRIVDFFGVIEKNQSIFENMHEHLKKNKYEYVDFISYGLENELLGIGFTKKKKNQLIPNRFEPFINKEILNNFCILKSKYKKNLIVKGDGDLDRPNSI